MPRWILTRASRRHCGQPAAPVDRHRSGGGSASRTRSCMSGLSISRSRCRRQAARERRDGRDLSAAQWLAVAVRSRRWPSHLCVNLPTGHTRRHACARKLPSCLASSIRSFREACSGSARPSWLSAVSNAGGLGILTALTQPTPEDLRREIERCRTMTDQPFGVNLTILPAITPPPYAEYHAGDHRQRHQIVETAGNNPKDFIGQAEGARDQGRAQMHVRAPRALGRARTASTS